MSENPKRPWFRFHLLTAVLLALVACALMSGDELLRYRMGPDSFDVFRLIVIPLDAMVLAVVAFASEYLIRRRREARKANS